MSDEKCPFCGEPWMGSIYNGSRFRCGTYGPDANGKYTTGHTCDITIWSRVLKAKDDEIARLTDRLNIAVEFVLACDQEKLCAWGYDHGLTACDQYPDLVHLCGRRCLELLRAADAAREG